MLVMLRDGRKIIGLMRSFDQFANIVLEEAVERIIVGKRFADVPLGLYVIRGENVVLLGEMVRVATTESVARICLMSARPSSVPQDDAKEKHTTTELLSEAPVEDLLREKREAEESQKLKASLARVARSGVQDTWDLD